MKKANFDIHLLSLTAVAYREEFEAALFELYKNADATQREFLRRAVASKSLGEPKPWKNPSDYDRSDLTREQRLRRLLFQISLSEGSAGFKEDLLTVAYCYHNFRLMGFDADQVLRDFAAISGPSVSRLLARFVARGAADKLLDAFGLKVQQTTAGFEAVQT